MRVYLCGGIHGLSDEACHLWRVAARDALRCDVIDPMRRDYRGREDAHAETIVRGDLADIAAADALLVNATRPSWGTAMEIVYAHQLGKPIVAFTESSVVSPWLRYHCTRVVGWLPDAAVVLRELVC